MSDILNDIKDDLGVEDYNTGRRAYFINPHVNINEVLKFASELHMIGYAWDRELKNHTEVLIISEITTAYHPERGSFPVIKVLHKDAM